MATTYDADVTVCPLCARLWRVDPHDVDASRHPCCLGMHEGETSIKIGLGPVTEFGWLHSSGPPAAFARGPDPVVALSDRTDSPLGFTGIGTDQDRSLAATKAVAELFERQTATLRPRAPIRYDASASVTHEVAFADVESTGEWWLETRSLRDGRAVLVPSGRFVPASQRNSVADACGDSTGMAVGVSRWHAVVAGLYEAVERIAVPLMLRDGPAWRMAARDVATGHRQALADDGWHVDVVGSGYGGFSVSVCVAARTDIDTVLGGSAARTSLREAAAAATMETYAKSLAFRSNSPARANSSVIGAVDIDWHGLPYLHDDGENRSVDPFELLRSGPLDAVFVDRGNPLLDGLGWSAAHVVLLNPPDTTGLASAWADVLG